MEKALLVMFILLSASKLIAQPDFRNANWGMTIDAVKARETSPLTKEEKSLSGYRNGQRYYDGVELLYENTTVAGIASDIYYHFDNGKLTKVRVLYRPSLQLSADMKISDIIKRFNPLYSALMEKGFRYTNPLRCGVHAYQGPDRENPDNLTLYRKYASEISTEAISLVEKMVNEKHYQAAFYRLESDRSRGLVQFSTRFSELKEYVVVMFELTPNLSIESDIKASDF